MKEKNVPSESASFFPSSSGTTLSLTMSLLFPINTTGVLSHECVFICRTLRKHNTQHNIYQASKRQ